MPKKTLPLSLFGIIIIGSAVYFASPKESKVPIVASSTVHILQNKKTQDLTSRGTSTEPPKNASTDEIIDYITYGISTDEISVTEKIMAATSSLTKDVIISTNF